MCTDRVMLCRYLLYLSRYDARDTTTAVSGGEARARALHNHHVPFAAIPVVAMMGCATGPAPKSVVFGMRRTAEYAWHRISHEREVAWSGAILSYSTARGILACVS